MCVREKEREGESECKRERVRVCVRVCEEAREKRKQQKEMRRCFRVLLPLNPSIRFRSCTIHGSAQIGCTCILAYLRKRGRYIRPKVQKADAAAAGECVVGWVRHTHGMVEWLHGRR